MTESKKLSPKERMTIPRQPMPEQPPQVRRHNFLEVPLGLAEDAAVLEAQRCIACKKPKCIDGCPVCIDIPTFLQQVADRDFGAAVQTIKRTNILPAICGRVCPQEDQCEAVCVIGRKVTPVAIGRLERFVADWERSQGGAERPVMGESTGCRVAIVGSGPAGLTAAYELARCGHAVTIFEALHKPGGVLFYGIPRFRLPADVIEHEIDFLESLGVRIELNTVIGRIATIDELMAEDGFDAVFLGTGAGLPWFPNLPGENLGGVYSANEYLTRINLMRADRFPEAATPVYCGKRVAVIGAGNTAMDAARTSLRLGPDNVTIYYRRTRDEAPARAEEIEHAMQEGVHFEWLTAPVEFRGDDDYFVKSMVAQRMELGEPDDSGRRRPKPISGSEYDVEVDTVVLALGFGVNPLVPSTTPDLTTNKWGVVVVDRETGQTSKRGVFAAGDVITGGATVILAMGQARTAAAGLHNWLVDEKRLDCPRVELRAAAPREKKESKTGTKKTAVKKTPARASV